MVLPILIAEHALPSVTGILLQPNGNTPKEYKRVGVVGLILKLYFNNAEDATIKIV
jgi:hypothetical protein